MNIDHFKKRLQENRRPKAQFLFHFSRDLKTHLDGILGFTQLLASQQFGPLNDRQTRYVSEIYENGKQLDSLINDYVDIARIDSGTLQLHYADLDIHEYVLWAYEMLQPQINEKKLDLKIIWNSPPEKIRGDSARLKQIIYILIFKALEFSYEGEKLVFTLSFDEEFLEGRLESDSLNNPLSRPDKGEGLSDMEERDKLKSNPLDLSLALAQKLIHLHGGKIGLEYKHGGGSYLWFTLAKRPFPGPVMERVLRPETQYVSKDSPLRILLVDDSSNIQNLVMEILKKAGCKVFLADNGQAGLEMAKWCQPDMIFMDINMPVMDGLQAIQSIRKIPELQNIPIVALTADDMEDSRPYLSKLGFTRLLNKPFRKTDLLDCVHSCFLSVKSEI